MVYNGPSTGCLTCRKRKVRCDKGRPQCNNCVRRKQPCPGYGDVFDTRHRDQTRTIIARADSKSVGASKGYLTPITSPECSSRATSVTRGSPTRELAILESQLAQQYQFPALSFNLPINLEDSAITFFFEYFGRVLGDCRAIHGFMPDLAPIYKEASVGSPIQAATASIAMNFFMLFAHQGSDTKQARSLYLKAVSGLKECLAKPDPGNYDELIMAVLALDFYDTLNSRFLPEPLRDDHHKRGALALLRHRGEMNYSTELSRIMVSHVRTNLVNWAIENETDVPADMVEMLTHPCLPKKNQHMLDVLALRLASLLSRFRRLQEERGAYQGTGTSTEHEDILEEALDLDQALMDWEDHIPPRWYPTIITPAEVEPSIQAAGMWNDKCPIYADLAICDVYNTYRRWRLRLLQLVQKLCFSSTRDDSADIFDYKGQIMRRLVDEICESVPFCMGDAMTRHIGASMPQHKYPSTWRKGTPFPHPSVDHPTSATASGGWKIYLMLTLLIQLAEPKQGLIPVQFRRGQLEWIRGQISRIETVYTFRTRR